VIIKDSDGFAISYEQVRKYFREADKFRLLAGLVGRRNAKKTLRALERLHTHYPGARTELDYTSFVIWLFPNRNASAPLCYYFGLGVDHMSTVIKGFTSTVFPTTAHTIRLYKICVQPKQFWLPDRLQHYAADWDVFGIERLVAIDNGPDFTADATVLVWLDLGVIVLLMPPGRPDYKGTVERTIESLETKYVMGLPGYVSHAHGFTTKEAEYDRIRAKSQAKYTVDEFIDIMVPGCLDHNFSEHPRFKKRRIHIWRDAMEMFPPILPTGLLQNKATFSRTYVTTLTREGVQVEDMMFNSDELFDLYREHPDKPVHARLDDDDIRSLIVFDKKSNEPIVANLTTHDWTDRPCSLELYRTAQRYGAEETNKILPSMPNYGDYVAETIRKLQAGETTPAPGMSARKHAEAVTQAEAVGATTARVTSEKTLPGLETLLRGSKI
jgi:hypothetical protein